MEDLIRESMDGFDEVWRRVTGKPGTSCPERTYAPEDMLAPLIAREACAMQMSAALARVCQGQTRQVLARHAAGAKMRLRRLRAEYFIAVGAAAPAPGPCPTMPEGRQAALRRLWLDAAALAERYEKAAGEADDAALQEVLAAFAGDSRARTRELRALLVASF